MIAYIPTPETTDAEIAAEALADAKAEYSARCESTGTDPIEFEVKALSVGDSNLPAFARAVRDGADPDAEYFDWLLDLIEAP